MATKTARDPRAVASGIRITKAMQLAGMKKMHLAEALRRKLDVDFEYARHSVKRWTNGYHRPRPETMEAIAEVMAEHTGQSVDVFRAALGIDDDDEEAEQVAEQRKVLRELARQMADELFDRAVLMQRTQRRATPDKEEINA